MSDTEREGVVYRKGGKKLSSFPYPGGKTSYVDEIVRQFPEHRRYAEPFGGSASVLLNKPPSYIEVFNDLNSEIVHFFEVVRERKDELQEWLRRTPFSRELHEKWGRAYYEGERPEGDLERAGRWYYLRYTQYGGKIDRFSGFKTSIKRNEARSLRGATEHLDELVARLQDVILENQDYQKVVDRYDRPDTLFYFDPPYLETTYNYYGTGEFDHQQLAELLADIKGYWICSYGDLPPSLKTRLIGNRREGGEWTVQQFTAHYTLDTEDGEERDEADEHLVMNFDPRDEPEFTAASQTTLEDAFVAATDGGNGRDVGADTDHDNPVTDGGQAPETARETIDGAPLRRTTSGRTFELQPVGHDGVAMVPENDGCSIITNAETLGQRLDDGTVYVPDSASQDVRDALDVLAATPRPDPIAAATGGQRDLRPDGGAVGSETGHDGPTIEVGASVYERFEAERERTKTDHVPPMDQGTFLSALLDTAEAVRDGYYERGLYEKYEVYKDGTPLSNCFVLEPESDSAAREALIRYAEVSDDEELAQDLHEWITEICTRGDRDV